MHAHAPLNPVPLGKLIGTKEWVWAHCLDCRHDRFIRPEDISLPASWSVYRISECMTCSACGSRNIHTKPSAFWAGLDPAKMLAPSFHEHGRLIRERGLLKELMEPRKADP